MTQHTSSLPHPSAIHSDFARADFSSVGRFGDRAADHHGDDGPSQLSLFRMKEDPVKSSARPVTSGESVTPKKPALLKIVVTDSTWTRDASADVAVHIFRRARPPKRNWFARRPHWRQRFTPTSSSWINQVERFFALIAEKQIKRGAHKSIKQPTAAIGDRGLHRTAQ